MIRQFFIVAALFLGLFLPCSAYTEEEAVAIVVDSLRLQLQSSERWYEWDVQWSAYWTVQDVHAPELPLFFFGHTTR